MLLLNQRKGILVNIILEPFFLSTEFLPVCNGQSGTSLLNHSGEEAKPGETSGSNKPNQTNGVVSTEPPLLRELNADLLQSGGLKLTGKCLSDIKIKLTHLYFPLLYGRGNPGYEQCRLVSSALS